MWIESSTNNLDAKGGDHMESQYNLDAYGGDGDY
jgi:hypothetical protein